MNNDSAVKMAAVQANRTEVVEIHHTDKEDFYVYMRKSLIYPRIFEVFPSIKGTLISLRKLLWKLETRKPISI